MARKTLEERFWAKVEKSDGCWMWRGTKNAYGYGMLTVDGRPRLAHRIAWELENGTIPPTFRGQRSFICHRCDRPLCVNHAHLYLGNAAMNGLDRMCTLRDRHYAGPPPKPIGMNRRRHSCGGWWQTIIRTDERLGPMCDTRKARCDVGYPRTDKIPKKRPLLCAC